MAYLLQDYKQLDAIEEATSIASDTMILINVNNEFKFITFANLAKSLGITNVPSTAPKFTGNVNEINTEYEVYGSIWN